MKTKYNSLKKRVLRVLSDHGSWISVPAIARHVSLPYSERGLYPYLRRLAAFDLVEAGQDKTGRIFYRITARGVQRLQFLKKKEVNS